MILQPEFHTYIFEVFNKKTGKTKTIRSSDYGQVARDIYYTEYMPKFSKIANRHLHWPKWFNENYKITKKEMVS